MGRRQAEVKPFFNREIPEIREPGKLETFSL